MFIGKCSMPITPSKSNDHGPGLVATQQVLLSLFRIQMSMFNNSEP